MDEESSDWSNPEYNPFGYRKNSDDSETDYENWSRLTRSVSVPNIEKLELFLNKIKVTKTMYSKKESKAQTDLSLMEKILSF